MKSLIVTVAGTATRFNKDTETETLKCLYYQESPQYCLLNQILEKACDFDEVIIVGGFLFDKLRQFIDQHLKSYASKIHLVYNPEYSTYGSGYSLLLGIQTVSPEASEIVFVEGDLYYDNVDFARVVASTKDVLTINREPIKANKAVVLYENMEGKVRYLYDTSHRHLRIDEPFLSVYNSAQIWKFVNPCRLREVIGCLTAEQKQGTNLEIIQAYFGALDIADYCVVSFDTWYNCNTVADYNKVFSIIKR